MNQSGSNALLLVASGFDATAFKRSLLQCGLQPVVTTEAKQALLALMSTDPRVVFVDVAVLPTEGLSFLRVVRANTGSMSGLPVVALGAMEGVAPFVADEARLNGLHHEVPSLAGQPVMRWLLGQVGLTPGAPVAPTGRQPPRVPKMPPPPPQEQQPSPPSRPTRRLKRSASSDRRPPTMPVAGSPALGTSLRVRVHGVTRVLPVESGTSEQLVVLARGAVLPESETMHLYYEGRIAVADAMRDVSVKVLARVRSSLGQGTSRSYVLDVLGSTPPEGFQALLSKIRAKTR